MIHTFRSWQILLKRLDWREMKTLWSVREELCLAIVSHLKSSCFWTVLLVWNSDRRMMDIDSQKYFQIYPWLRKAFENNINVLLGFLVVVSPHFHGLVINACLGWSYNCRSMSFSFYIILLWIWICVTDDLIVDPRNFEWMREANCPVVSISWSFVAVE